MDTCQATVSPHSHLLGTLNRTVRRRLFDSHVEDLHRAVCHYGVAALSDADLVTILAGELQCLKDLQPDDEKDERDVACDFGALALVEGLIEQCGSAEAVTEQAIDAAVDLLVERLHDALVEDIVGPECDPGGCDVAQPPSAGNPKEASAPAEAATNSPPRAGVPHVDETRNEPPKPNRSAPGTAFANTNSNSYSESEVRDRNEFETP